MKNKDLIVKYLDDNAKTDIWQLYESIVVTLSDNSIIWIPKGFETDFASVPRLFWSLIPEIGKYNFAALIHDYLYVTHLKSREFADREFYYWLMKAQPNKYIRNKIMYLSVKHFGSKKYYKKDIITEKIDHRW